MRLPLYWLVLLPLAVLAGPTSAQVEVLAVGGPVRARLVGTDADARFGYRTTFEVGVGAQAPVVGPLFVRLEVLSTGRGAAYEEANELFSQRSRYISVPVIVGLGVPTSGSMRVAVSGGVEFGFLVGCQITFGVRPLQGPNDPPQQIVTQTQDCNDRSPGAIPNFYTRTSAIEAVGGIETSYRRGRIGVMAGLRASRGLRTIVPPPGDAFDIRGQIIGARVGVVLVP